MGEFQPSLRPAAIRCPVDPRDIPVSKAARRLGLTESQFLERRDELLARGFPRPDPTTGQYDLKAIDAWMDRRSSLTAPRDARQAPEALREAFHAWTPIRPATDVGRPRVMRIPYSPVRNGKRYFQPTPEMRRAGFRPLALGPDDEASRARAMRLYEQWTAYRLRPSEPLADARQSKYEACIARRYPIGSIGEAWQRWICSDEWARLAPSTRSKIWWKPGPSASSRPSATGCRTTSLWTISRAGAH